MAENDSRIIPDGDLAAIRNRVGPTAGWNTHRARRAQHGWPQLDWASFVPALLDHIEATTPTALTKASYPGPGNKWWNEWVCYHAEVAWTDDDGESHAGRFHVVAVGRSTLTGMKAEMTLEDADGQNTEIAVEWITSIRALDPPAPATAAQQ